VGEEVAERFRPTSGRVTGFFVAVVGLAVVLVAALPGDQGIAPYVVWGVLLALVLAWGAMIRPGVWATDDDLVLRNMLSTTTIPLAAIEQVVVRQVLAVRAGHRRYVSPAVGTSLRQLRHVKKQANDDTMPGQPRLDAPYGTFVEDRIHHLAELARVREGIGLMSDEQIARADDVRREWAYVEIAALVTTGLGFALAVVLAL